MKLPPKKFQVIPNTKPYLTSININYPRYQFIPASVDSLANVISFQVALCGCLDNI